MILGNGAIAFADVEGCCVVKANEKLTGNLIKTTSAFWNISLNMIF